MKKLRNAAIAAVLAGTLLLAACGGGDTPASQSSALQPSEKGRYVETDITPVAGSSRLQQFQQADGSLVCFNDDWTTRYDSTDGGATWTESPGPGAKDERFKNVWNATMLEDGSLLAELGEEKDGKYTSQLVKLTPDGAVEPFAFPEFDELIADGKDASIQALQALPGNRLYISFGYGYGNAASGEGEGEDADEAPEGEEPPASEDAPESSVTPLAATPSEAQGGESASGAGDAAKEEEDPTSQQEEGDPSASGADEGEGGENNVTVGGGYESFNGLYDMETGKKLADLTEAMPMSTAYDKENLYLLGYDHQVSARSLSDGKAVQGVEGKLAGSDMFFGVGMGAGEDGSLYFADNKALQKMAPGSKSFETLMDAGAYSFGSPGKSVSGLDVQPDGSFIMGLMAQESAQLLKYTWDENATVDPNQALNVWALQDNPVLRAAISEFRKKNPEATVNLEVALPEDSSVTAEDAIKELNTRLLAGEGPDLIMLDGCPVESYAGSGILADLTELVDASGMYSQLRTPFEGEKGTFALPMRWKAPVLLGSAEDLAKAATLEELLKVVEEGAINTLSGEGDDTFSALPREQRAPLSFESVDEAFNLLWNAGAEALLDEKGISEEALRTFLESLKAISDKYKLTEVNEANMGAMAMSTEGGSVTTIQGSPLSYAVGRTLYGGLTADDMQSMFFMDENPDTEASLFPGQAPGSWVPGALVGINAESPKKELAAQFMQQMLSDEVQSLRLGGGLPVTQSGFKKQDQDVRDTMKEMQEQQNGMADESETTDEADTGFDFTPVLDGLTQPLLVDAVVREMVYNQANDLCFGITDVDTAVQTILQNTANYLAERK